MTEYKLIEHYLPNAEMPMDNWWYGYWIEFIGTKKEFEKHEAELMLQCYQKIIELSKDRALGFVSVEQITKKDMVKDALNNQVFKATVGIKWHEKPKPNPSA